MRHAVVVAVAAACFLHRNCLTEEASTLASVAVAGMAVAAAVEIGNSQ